MSHIRVSRRVPWPAVAVSLVPLSFPVEQLELPTPVRIVYLAAIIAVVVVGWDRLRHAAMSRRLSPLRPFALFVVSALLSTAGAADPVAALRLVGTYGLGLTLAAATAVVGADRRSAHLIFNAVCLVGGGICVQASVTASSLTPHYGAAVVDNRATGIFGQPNELGAFAALVVVMCVAGLFAARTHWTRLAIAASLAAGLAAVAETLSRGAWVGLLLGLIVLPAVAPGIRRGFLAALGVLAVGVGIAASLWPGQPLLGIVLDRAASIVDGDRNPYDFRPQIWTEALRQLEGHPWLGVGPGGYPLLAARSPSQVTTAAPEHAHSLLLTVAAEQGLVGVTLLAIAVTVAVRAVVSARRQLSRPDDRILLGGIAGGLAVVLGQGLLDYTLRNAVLATVVWLLLGLLVALSGPNTDIHSRQSTLGGNMPSYPRHRRGRGLVVVSLVTTVVLLAAALAAVQFWPARYAATSVVSLTPRQGVIASADTIELVGQKYAVVATSSDLLQTAGRSLAIDPDDLGSTTTVALAAGTGNLQIVVERPDRAQAVAAANLVAQLVTQSAANDPLVVAEVTASASPSRAVLKPSRPILRAIATIVVLLLGLGLWSVLSGRWRRPAVGVPVVEPERVEDGPPRARGPVEPVGS